jgi:hypothetical protein
MEYETRMHPDDATMNDIRGPLLTKDGVEFVNGMTLYNPLWAIVEPYIVEMRLCNQISDTAVSSYNSTYACDKLYADRGLAVQDVLMMFDHKIAKLQEARNKYL